MIDITIDDSKFKDFLRRFKQKINQRPDTISRALSDAAELALGRAKAHYLTGAALKVQTGRLRSSVTKSPPTGAIRQGNDYLVQVGTNVEYGRFWEYGYHGKVQVKMHERIMKKAFGRDLKTPKRVTVSAHTRHVDQDPRPWLAPAFRDEKSNIRRILAKAGVLFE